MNTVTQYIYKHGPFISSFCNICYTLNLTVKFELTTRATWIAHFYWLIFIL